jgi:hypothetical protein
MKDLLLALGKKPSDEKPTMDLEIDSKDMGDESEPGMDDAGYEAAASEVMDAFKSGDSKMLSDALKSFVDMCK